MSAHRRRRIDRDTAELLLREAADGRHTGKDPLLDLLVAVSVQAPPDTDDRVPPGEQDAVDVFLAARANHAVEPHKKSAIKVAVASVLTWKALAAAGITASAIGGAAIMGGDQQPDWMPHESRPLTRTPASTMGSPAPMTRPGRTQDATSDGSTPGVVPGPSESSTQSAYPSANASASTSANRSSSAAPSSSHVGLCRAYEAQGGSSGDRQRNPAFADLVQVAGGEDNVAAYCQNLLSAKAGPAPKASSNTATSPTTTQEPPTIGDSQSDPGTGQPKRPEKAELPSGG